MRRTALQAWTALSVLLVGVLFAVNWALGQDIKLVGDLILPPLIAGLTTTPRRTAIVTALAIAAAVVSAAVTDQVFDANLLLRLSVICVASGLAVQTAILRERDLRTRRRLSLINSARAELDVAVGLEEKIVSFGRAATADFAEFCFIDLRMPDDDVTRIVLDSETASDKAVPRQAVTGAAGAYANNALREGPMLFRHPEQKLLEALFEREPEEITNDGQVLIVPVQAAGFSVTYFMVCPRPVPPWGEAELTQVESLARAAALAAQSDRLIDQLSFTQQELRGSRDQIEAVVQGIADGVVVQSVDGEMIYANDPGAHLLGFDSAEQMLGQHFADVADRLEIRDDTGTPFDPQQLPSRRALAGEERPEQMLRYTIKETGQEYWTLVKATAILGADGTPTMAVTVIEDLTTHQRAESSQRFLAEASKAMAESLDPTAAVEAIATAAVPALADWCAVELLDAAGGLIPKAVAHTDPEFLGPLRKMRQDRIADVESHGAIEVVRTGIPQLFEHLEPDTWRETIGISSLEPVPQELVPHSKLIAPIMVHGRPLGAISMALTRTGGRFSDFDLETAMELGRRAGVAIDNARLHDERSRMLDALQNSLIPAELPVVAGFDLAARFRPATAEAEVGGDFYDVFTLPDGTLAAVIGDVCGKGPEAAALTALARYTIRTAAMHDSSLESILRTLNSALIGQVDDGRFCTVAMARFGTTNGTSDRWVEIIAAGHPLPLRLDGGKPQPLGEIGTLLGVVESPDLPVVTATIATGEAIVLYTDGLSGGQTTEDTKFAVELAEGISTVSAESVAAGLDSAALSSQTEPNRDDVAILVTVPVPVTVPVTPET
ncbi:MAG: SpoIIE family protein phosphatase [Solirubrobacterales bacterium]